MIVTRRFEIDKRTKGAIRYREITDTEPIVGKIYIRKTELPDEPPNIIIVTVNIPNTKGKVE